MGNILETGRASCARAPGRSAPQKTLTKASEKPQMVLGTNPKSLASITSSTAQWHKACCITSWRPVSIIMQACKPLCSGLVSSSCTTNYLWTRSVYLGCRALRLRYVLLKLTSRNSSCRPPDLQPNCLTYRCSGCNLLVLKSHVSHHLLACDSDWTLLALHGCQPSLWMHVDQVIHVQVHLRLVK